MLNLGECPKVFRVVKRLGVAPSPNTSLKAQLLFEIRDMETCLNTLCPLWRENLQHSGFFLDRRYLLRQGWQQRSLVEKKLIDERSFGKLMSFPIRNWVRHALDLSDSPPMLGCGSGNHPQILLLLR